MRETNEEERWVRLFCVLPKSMTDSELQQEFLKFGPIEYATVVKDRNTNESKGFGYVKFKKVSSAARAFEECDRKYKAVFAEPKKPKPEHIDVKYNNGISSHYEGASSGYSSSNFGKSSISLEIATNYPNSEGYTHLQVIAHPALNQDQLWKLFDIVPGLDYCHLKNDVRYRMPRGQAVVVYSNPSAAAYAREKFHGFEYPPGHRMIVKPDLSSVPPKSVVKPGSSTGGIASARTDLAHLAETIAQATSLIQAAGLTAPSERLLYLCNTIILGFVAYLCIRIIRFRAFDVHQATARATDGQYRCGGCQEVFYCMWTSCTTYLRYEGCFL